MDNSRVYVVSGSVVYHRPQAWWYVEVTASSQQAEGWWCDKSVTFLRYQPSKGKERKVSRLVKGKGERFWMLGELKKNFFHWKSFDCEFLKKSEVLTCIFFTGYLKLIRLPAEWGQVVAPQNSWSGGTLAAPTQPDFQTIKQTNLMSCHSPHRREWDWGAVNINNVTESKQNLIKQSQLQARPGTLEPNLNQEKRKNRLPRGIDQTR